MLSQLPALASCTSVRTLPLELDVQANPFFLKLLVVMVYDHRKRKATNILPVNWITTVRFAQCKRVSEQVILKSSQGEVRPGFLGTVTRVWGGLEER